MKYRIEFNLEKDAWLQEKRGVSFKEIKELIEAGESYDIDIRKSEKFSHQQRCAVQIKGHFWSVPYVVDHFKKIIFLKTAWADRKINAEMKRGDNNDQVFRLPTPI